MKNVDYLISQLMNIKKVSESSDAVLYENIYNDIKNKIKEKVIFRKK